MKKSITKRPERMIWMRRIRKHGKTTEKKTAKRMLVTFGKHQTDSYQEECHVLMEGGDRSAWYKALTEEFYL